MSDKLEIALREELERLVKEHDRHQEAIRIAETELATITPRLRLVRELLGEPAPDNGGESGLDQEAPFQAQATPPEDICDVAEVILAARNQRPMYYKELAQEVQKQGVVIRGARPEANLVARMLNDPQQRFVRPHHKGYYALRKDYPDAQSVGARRK